MPISEDDRDQPRINWKRRGQSVTGFKVTDHLYQYQYLVLVSTKDGDCDSTSMTNGVDVEVGAIGESKVIVGAIERKNDLIA